MERCIIVDLDGTLSLFDKNKRNPYDRDFENDEVNIPVLDVIKSYLAYKPIKLIFLSGRNDKFKSQTLDFIVGKCKLGGFELHMRKDKDFRKDVIIKEEMYNKFIKGKYQVDFVIDDRLQVCRLWYSLGLFVLNVNQGLIEF